MNATMLLVISILIPVAALAAGIMLYRRAHTRLTANIDKKIASSRSVPAQFRELQEQFQELEHEVSKFNLKASELEEHVTRTMNKVTARYSRSEKNLEKYEMLQDLLEQSQQVEQPGNGQSNLQFRDPNQPQRLRRKR